MENEILKQQKEICKKYNINWTPSELGLKIGISKNINSDKMPINGLRYQPENGTSGWYIWAGDYSDDNDFFEPIHVAHLEQKCPLILKYLGLPPGYRFQIDNKGYEDVWEDKNLIAG